jgi:hypothetical protein
MFDKATTTVTGILETLRELPGIKAPFDKKAQLAISRDTAHQIARADRGGPMTSTLEDDAQRAVAKIQADCERAVGRFVSPTLTAADETERRLAAKTLEATRAAAEAHSELAKFQHAANTLRRAAGKPQRPIVADLDATARANEFEQKVVRLNLPAHARTAARPPLPAPDYADLVASDPASQF